MDAVLDSLMLLGVFLIVGFAIRELVPALRKLFIPASIIGGTVALLLGQQVLGVITIPDAFEALPGALIGLVMTGLIFGTRLNWRQARSAIDYGAVTTGVYGMQVALGLALGLFLAQFWTDLPEGWGLMGIFSFFGGHGTAAAVGTVFEEQGVYGNLEIGMILSTIGMIVGIVVGMILVNRGIRKGSAAYASAPDQRPAWSMGGRVPKNERTPIGYTAIASSNIGSLALQFSWLMLAMFLGTSIFQGLALIWEGAASVPSLFHGMFGALIIWPLMQALKVDHYVDKRTIDSITGLALEIIILSAIATLSIQFAAQFAAPLLIFSAVIVIATTWMTFFFMRRFAKEEWFEKTMMSWGANTGNTSVGLALVRATDPEGRSTAPEAHGIFSGVSIWTPILPVILPILTLQTLWGAVGFGAVYAALGIALGWLFLSKKRTKSRAGASKEGVGQST